MMRNVINKISKHKDEWYAMPLVGLFFLMIIIPGLIFAKTYSQKPKDSTPIPTPTLSPNNSSAIYEAGDITPPPATIMLSPPATPKPTLKKPTNTPAVLKSPTPTSSITPTLTQTPQPSTTPTITPTPTTTLTPSPSLTLTPTLSPIP